MNYLLESNCLLKTIKNLTIPKINSLALDKSLIHCPIFCFWFTQLPTIISPLHHLAKKNQFKFWRIELREQCLSLIEIKTRITTSIKAKLNKSYMLYDIDKLTYLDLTIEILYMVMSCACFWPVNYSVSYLSCIWHSCCRYNFKRQYAWQCMGPDLE